MRRPNGGVIWLLIAGVAMGFAFNIIVSYFLLLKALIPTFIVLVLSGILCSRVLGRAGGEFSEDAKNYSVLLVGFMFGLAFDLFRVRYHWYINVFKYIALGTFFILVAVFLKRNLENYTEDHPADGPHLGLFRPSILYVLAGFSFAIAINVVIETYLFNLFFFATLPALVAISILVTILSKADYDLLENESGVWTQLFSGAALGIAYDLMFRVIIWQDLIKLVIIFAMFIITASVIRMKQTTRIDTRGTRLDLGAQKTKKKKGKVVGTIDLTPREPKKKTTTTKPSSRKSSQRRRSD
ncbi:MAG: hypothetical protein KGD59_14585 [Candidatus Heimdallarchaeota archaeon]|nr:hypothetical protein [Candidatus Heimdallarchaeota archaeon]MBY8995775.1 hypothetical protein [Candidatus Heimdallarchaeota archaeon]